MLGEPKLSFEMFWTESPGDLTPCTKCESLLSDTMFVFVVQVIQGNDIGDRKFSDSDMKVCSPCYMLVKDKI